MNQAGYYRYPTLNGNRVVFVCEDDLWMVPLSGGTAVRLTANLGEVTRPLLSPDGSLLAFTGREEGHPEVYAMPATGGEATRLTFTGSASVAGWTPDGRIAFSSSATQPFPRMPRLYAIDPAGGLPEELPFGVGNAVSFAPHSNTHSNTQSNPQSDLHSGNQNRVVIGRNISDPARWKRYRGGTAGVLWVDAEGNGEFRLLIRLNGNLAAPMWIGDRVYFISDHEGIGNIYSCTPAGEDLRRHTYHGEYYARHASTDGQRIVYHAGAELYCFDPEANTDQRIAVDFFSPRVQRQRKFVEANEFLDGYDLHPEGHSITLTTRGKPFAFSNWEGAVLSLTQEDTGRYRLTRWLNDKKRLVSVSDRTEVEALEILSLELGIEAEILEGLDIGRVNQLEVSPTADQVILTNHRQELIWIDLATKELQILDRSDFARIQGFSWSPDGKWVTYSCAESQLTFSIKLCRLEDRSLYRLTPPRFRDMRPCFDPGGKFIYFLSVRDFNPVYDGIYFDLGFPKGMRPFLISLQKDTPNPFVPQSKLLNGKTEDKKENKSEEKKEKDKQNDSEKEKKKIEPIKIDLEGIDRRILGFPVNEGIYGQIWGVEGKVLFTTYPVTGTMDRGNGGGKGTLELYDFEAQKQERLACEVSSFRVSRDHKTVIYRSGDRLRVCSTNPQDKERAKDEPGKKSGWLQLDRIRVSVMPAQEWQQMFKEIWRLQQQQFWTSDMSGVDWQRVYDRYRPLLDRVSTRSEFSDLIWEMQGELGTSHAYEYGGDYRENPDYYLGYLGADFQYDPETNGYRITHIVQGDSWTDQDSPLNQIGLNVQEGDILLAVNGQRVGQHRSPQELLVHQSGCEVNLTFAARPEESQPQEAEPETSQGEADQTEAIAPETSPTAAPPTESSEAQQDSLAQETPEPKPTTRTIAVKTLYWEGQIRYREWVERNYRQVTEASNGRIGYLHIPDMGAHGYAEFHRYYFAEVHKQGLIVDVRYNGGGHVSQLLLEKLARERIGYDVSRWGKPEPYPSDSVLGPIVALTDENAGSDGDIFSHCFKLMKIGTLIGKRTWGGVIGISPSHSLVDGSIVTQPEYSFWFKDVGWSVENYGTDPDIEVEITPQDWRQGRDSQLEKAIEVALTQLEQQDVNLPNFGDRPYLPLP
ncbi:S41 family peptidase [Leptolyngbya ohadii]|uniref:S41 family peptidase n=1 Tax=Leptolyngbya ohadii TaxID=1962290 RepID=UPI000B59CE74|nr:S41 family peptidase [Leptolyngbya ohadii]